MARPYTTVTLLGMVAYQVVHACNPCTQVCTLRMYTARERWVILWLVKLLYILSLYGLRVRIKIKQRTLV